MAPSREAFHADAKETNPLVGVGQEAPEAEAAPAAVYIVSRSDFAPVFH